MTTHYIRDSENKSIVDCETSLTREGPELRCLVDVEYFARFLRANESRYEEIVADFKGLQELRGEWWEMVGKRPDVHEFARRRLQEVAARWPGLYYVRD